MRARTQAGWALFGAALAVAISCAPSSSPTEGRGGGAGEVVVADGTLAPLAGDAGGADAGSSDVDAASQYLPPSGQEPVVQNPGCVAARLRGAGHEPLSGLVLAAACVALVASARRLARRKDRP